MPAEAAGRSWPTRAAMRSTATLPSRSAGGESRTPRRCTRDAWSAPGAEVRYRRAAVRLSRAA
eukprot:10456903-Lingulodinium_polyedra.AAC.1